MKRMYLSQQLHPTHACRHKHTQTSAHRCIRNLFIALPLHSTCEIYLLLFIINEGICHTLALTYCPVSSFRFSGRELCMFPHVLCTFLWINTFVILLSSMLKSCDMCVCECAFILRTHTTSHPTENIPHIYVGINNII